MAAVMAGCGGAGGGSDASPGTPSGVSNPPGGSPGDAGTPGTGNHPPTISGTPATTATVGQVYDLTPTAQDSDGDTLAFSITNRPTWATFSTATGRLSGTPQAAGTVADIVISVSDGKSSAALPAFTITIAAATANNPPPASGKAVALSWNVPTQTVNGNILTNLSGYRIHYGRSADALTESIVIDSAGANTYTVLDLKTGTYYFAVRAVTADGSESSLSNVISRSIS